MSTGPSEPLALISAVTPGGGGATDANPITTESLTLVEPFVQSSVNVVEADVVGYHGWLGLMGPSFPESVIPETPDGEVN